MRLCTYSVEPGAPRLGAECGGAVLDLARYSHLHEGLRLPADMLGLIESIQADNAEMGRTVTVQGSVSEPYVGVPQLLKRCIANLVRSNRPGPRSR